MASTACCSMRRTGIVCVSIPMHHRPSTEALCQFILLRLLHPYQSKFPPTFRSPSSAFTRMATQCHLTFDALKCEVVKYSYPIFPHPPSFCLVVPSPSYSLAHHYFLFHLPTVSPLLFRSFRPSFCDAKSSYQCMHMHNRDSHASPASQPIWSLLHSIYSFFAFNAYSLIL